MALVAWLTADTQVVCAAHDHTQATYCQYGTGTGAAVNGAQVCVQVLAKFMVRSLIKPQLLAQEGRASLVFLLLCDAFK